VQVTSASLDRLSLLSSVHLHIVIYVDHYVWSEDLDENLVVLNVISSAAYVIYVDHHVWSEDLDENLVVLDAKLRHMREDIAAIESSNNSLELQQRNNIRLLETLQVLHYFDKDWQLRQPFSYAFSAKVAFLICLLS
jgi:hypothetical protein